MSRRYAILMMNDEKAWAELPPAEQERVGRCHEELQVELRAAGRLVSFWGFGPSEEARTLERDADGTIAISSGGLPVGREVLGGVYVIEAESIDEALVWAEKGRFVPGTNEVREVVG